ncbi:MAG TPA: winged helix-turn-helix transcriptional regulator [Anaerolineales bacterium]|nr:winged helix-turn-helix transcriptional regulator [Anaerolineales bacterium]
MRTRARKKVLEYIARHPGVAAVHIARALGSTAPAVRHHLAILIEDGRISSSADRHGGSRGRPRLTFRVSEAIAGNSLAMLADHLLTAWTGDGTPSRGGRAGLVNLLSRRLAEQLTAPAPQSSAARRLAALVERLNQLHYDARWEAGSEGPRVIFGHCPYAAVLERHPELCRVDARAMATVMDADVQQKTKIDLRGHGPQACMFVLKHR